MNYTEGKYIVSNLHLPNKILAQKIIKTESQIRNFLHRKKIKRTPKQLEQIKFRVGASMLGERNPHWKGGISKNHYHYKKIQVERFPEKISARRRIYYHKKVGNIIPGVCYRCGTDEKIEAHHSDYNNPLYVVWLCNACHRELHQREWEQSNRSIKPLQLSQQMDLFKNYNTFSKNPLRSKGLRF